MDISDLIKKDQEQNQELQQDEAITDKSFTIPEDAGFVADIDELAKQLHKNLVNMYSNPAAVNDELIKKNGAMLAMLDKYIDTRRNIYMLTKVKIFR